jgi:beta-lactamase family protein
VRSFDLGTTNLGTGDVWYTVDDLIRWDNALAAGELLSRKRHGDMLTAHVPVSPDRQDETWVADGYGYGWFVGTVTGRRVYFHPGNNPGYLAFKPGCQMTTPGLPSS